MTAMRETRSKQHAPLSPRARRPAHVEDTAQNIWTWNVSTQTMAWSREVFEVLGLDPRTTTPSPDWFFQLAVAGARRRARQALREALRELRPIEDSYDVIRPDGELRRLRLRGQPLYDGLVGAGQYAGILLDVTTRRQPLAPTRRRQALYVASIAHELNQPLAAVILNAQAGRRWLRGADPNIQKAQVRLASIVRDASRAADLLARVRTLLTPTVEPPRRPCAVDALIHAALRLTRGRLRGSGVKVRLDLAPDLPPIVGDSVQLQEVLINLLNNAIDACGGLHERRSEILVTSGLDPHGGVRVSIQDSGVGLGQETLARMFEPFYSTKRHGMGIGLSLSRQIVARHGGRLWAARNAARGATLYMTLPVQNHAQRGPAP